MNRCTLPEMFMFTTRDVLATPYSSQSQYNCCKKINCGSEYPFTVDLNNVSDVGDWLSVTGRRMWWSSVPSGRESGKVISEGFTSNVSDNGLFCMESCSLKGWSSVLESRILSAPEIEGKQIYAIFEYKTKTLRLNLLTISSTCIQTSTPFTHAVSLMLIYPHYLFKSNTGLKPRYKHQLELKMDLTVLA